MTTSGSSSVHGLDQSLTVTHERGSRLRVPPVPPTPPQDGVARPQGAISDCCLAAPSVMQFDPTGNLLRAWGGPVDPGFCRPLGGDPERLRRTAIPCATTRQLPVAGANRTRDLRRRRRFRLLGGQRRGEHQVLKFTADGQFLCRSAAVRSAPPVRAQQQERWRCQRYAAAGPAGGYGRGPDHQRAVHRRRLQEQARPRGRCHHRHVQAALGCLRPRPSDAAPAPYNPNVRRPALPQPRALRAHHEGRPGLRVRPDEQPLPGVRQEQAGSCDEVPGLRRHVFRQRRDVGHRLLTRQATEVSLQRRWRESTRRGLRPGACDLLSTFGRNGRSAGQFHWVHNLAVDSNGNIYTAEVDTGKRAQKFVVQDRRDRDRDDDRD